MKRRHLLILVAAAAIILLVGGVLAWNALRPGPEKLLEQFAGMTREGVEAILGEPDVFEERPNGPRSRYAAGWQDGSHVWVRVQFNAEGLVIEKGVNRTKSLLDRIGELLGWR